MIKKLSLARWKASSSADEELASYLTQPLRDQFSNPQRQGCPEEEVLKRVAVAKIPLEEVAPLLDHLGSCSDCFRDFERFRAEKARRRHLRLSWAVAAGLLVSLSLSLWLRQVSKGPTNQAAFVRPTPQIGAAKAPEEGLASAVLHLEMPSTTRGGSGKSLPVQQLPRTRVALSVYLSPDDEPGKYEIELIKDISDVTPTVKFGGDAVIKNGLPMLRATVNLSAVPSDTYVARFRKVGGVWRYSHVALF